MQAHRLKVTVPEDHQLEIRLPGDFPAGPAEIIVLSSPSSDEGGRGSKAQGDLLAALEKLRTLERTEEEERVLEEFDRFRQESPFNLTSLIDEDR